MEMTITGGVHRLPEEWTHDDSLERVASELQQPLNVIKLSAQGLLRQLQDTRGDPTDISAAEKLIHSVERMNRLVRALQEVRGTELP
jgi:signal transduction histidine kinase